MSSLGHKHCFRNLFSLVILIGSAALVAHDIEWRSSVQASIRLPEILLASKGDTPIKVGGGAMTFFSHSGWFPMTTSVTGPFCVAIAAGDLNQIKPERYMDASGDVPSTIDVGSGDWSIVFLTHQDKKNEGLKKAKPSSNGIRMDASANAVCQGQTGSIKISPLPNTSSSFYDSELVTTRYYAGNRRFQSSKCEDVDRCERVAELDVYVGRAPNGVPDQRYTCADGECALFIGTPVPALTPTHRRHRRPHRPRSYNSR